MTLRGWRAAERRLGSTVDALAEALRGARAALAVALVAAGYLLTAAGNLAEPDDAYAFAWRVEQVSAWQFDDPRLLGYHLLARAAWRAAQQLGLTGIDGLQVLRGIAWLSAVAALVLLWRVLALQLRLARPVALLATVALAASYGFWRYAVEGDVYATAIALTLLVLHGLLSEGARRPGVAAAIGAAAGASVLVYQPCAIPLLIAFPLLAWRRGGARAALAYAGLALAVVAAGYAAALLAWWPQPLSAGALRAFLAQRSEEFQRWSLTPRGVAGALVRAGVALAHDIAATGWAFAFEPVQALAQRLFASHELADDVYLARAAGLPARLAVLSYALVVLTAARLLVLALLPLRSAGAGAELRPLPGAGAELLPALLVWTLLTAAVIVRLNPGGIEAWIVVLAPLALLLALFVIAPVVSRHGSGPAAAFVLALLVHNVLGGMALVQRAEGDLVGRQCTTLAPLLQARDLVVAARSTQLVECLRWRSPALALTVAPLGQADLLYGLHGGAPRPVVSIGRSSHAGLAVDHLALQRLVDGGRVLMFGSDLDLEPDGRFVLPQELRATLQRGRASPVFVTFPDGSRVHLVAGGGERR